MGFLKKAFSAVSSPVSAAIKTISNIPKDPVGSISSLGKQFANTGLDVATGGNKRLVNDLSGGLMDSAVGAAGGNSKDIIRLGATGGAAFFGGPMGAMAANNVLAGGGNFLQAAMAAGAGGEMSIFNDVGSFFNSNPALAQMANSAISGFGQKSAPVVQQQAPEVRVIQVPTPASGGMSKGMMMGIGGAVVAVVLVLVLFLKRK